MLGIDIGNYSVKVAVARKSGKKAFVDKVAMHPLPAEMRGGVVDVTTLQQITAQLYKQLKLKETKVALSISTASAILRTLTVDGDLTGDILEGEVQLELVNFVPFPLEQVYADYVSLGKSEQDDSKQDIFVAVSRRETVDKVANAIKVKTIKEKQVDIEAFCVGQVIESLHPKDGRAYAVLDIGYRSSNFYVFKNGTMIFSREQQVGGNHLTEAIADATGVSPEKAESMKITNVNSVSSSVIESYLDLISEQVMLAYEFYGANSPELIEQTYLTGGGSKVEGLLEALTENIPERAFARLPLGERLRSQKHLQGVTAEEVPYFMTTAIGLVMRG